MALILLVMLRDLGLALLENFDFEATFARPLFTEIDVKLFNRFILKILYLSLHLLTVVNLFRQKPGESLHQ